jgi:hypothetical protein
MMMSKVHATAAGDRRALDQAFGSDPLEPLTVEAIEDNPWLAVVRDLQVGADAEVIWAAAWAADALIERATKWANEAANPVEKEKWLDLIPVAERQVERVASFGTPWPETDITDAPVYERYAGLVREESEVNEPRDYEIPGRGR